ncbi:hypothetical protein [Bacillus sp. FJAT-47783]|uniref:hypothetical protein n=1 Tax=Bacillus sp. FJAT-47783 TaxID=2922712 RepID=UPI001FAC8634|nr:hypothetical protein [Bacillus sp. FJAT-47783]
MKLSKFIFLGTVLYLFLFLFDYFITLFSIDETGVYMSKLGLKIDMIMNEEELFTTFSLTPQILVTYGIWLLFICLCYFGIKKFRARSISS